MLSNSAEVLLAHGSRNEIFLVDGPAGRFFDTDAEMRAFVRALNDREGIFGGGDGLYFVDDRPLVPELGYYNSDGSTSSLCGNGLRCVMRQLMDRRGVDTLEVRIGANRFRGRRAADLAPGVPGVALDLLPATFDPHRVPVHTSLPELIDAVIPELHPSLRFTAVAVPNPHLVTIVESYDERLLIELGEQIAQGLPAFPEGINVSFVLPLAADDIFVRTYERGAALTPSCGSGNVGSRVAYSRLTGHPTSARVTVRNAGGVAVSWIDEATSDPALEGNATWVYRTTVAVAEVLSATHPPVEPDLYESERAAYAEVERANLDVLAGAGIQLG